MPILSTTSSNDGWAKLPVAAQSAVDMGGSNSRYCFSKDTVLRRELDLLGMGFLVIRGNLGLIFAGLTKDSRIVVPLRDFVV